MLPLLPLSLVEQVLEHLREGFRSGHWCGQLPGVRTLARELAVSKDTMEVALQRLETEGVLKSGGPGRCREVVMPRSDKTTGRVLRIGVLLSGRLEEINLHAQRIILGLVRTVENAGHECFFAAKSMHELGDNSARITRLAAAGKADAWVVYSGLADVLDWFVARSIPVMAIGGAMLGRPVASSSTDLSAALRAAVLALTDLGHRRIVTIAPDSWRIPEPSFTARGFLTAMEECGNHSTSYNLPAWENTPQGLEQLLESLFRVTPPTALLLVDPAVYVATFGLLGLKGLRVPRDISLVSMTTSPMFGLVPQRLAHFKWPEEEHIRRIVRWVGRLAKGDPDVAQVTFEATFDPGESIGPAINRRA